MSELSLENAIAFAAGNTAPRYRGYTTPEELRQQLWLYVLGDGEKHINRCVEDADEFGLNRILFGVAKRYAETEKAQKSGYHFSDVAWYSPEKLADLIPLALDPEWDGLTGAGPEDEQEVRSGGTGREGGTLLAMIADVRRVLPRFAAVEDFDPTDEDGLARLVALSDRLGGEFPESPGWGRGRRASSNGAAVAATRQGYSE